MRRSIAVLFVIALAASVALAQANNSAVGTYKLNVKKSEFGKMPAPKSEKLVILDDKDSSLKWRASGVGPDGKPFNESFSGAFDGKPYPVKGGGEFVTGAFTRGADGVKIEWKMKDGSTATETSTMQGDSMTNKMTVAGETSTLVFDKVKTAAGAKGEGGDKPAAKPAAKK